MVAPEIIDLEFLSAVRRQARRGTLDGDAARSTIVLFLRLGIRRVSHTLLLWRAWSHRDNLTAYDACYVALAEILGATLVTADRRLARAPGIGCAVEVIGLPPEG